MWITAFTSNATENKQNKIKAIKNIAPFKKTNNVFMAGFKGSLDQLL